jgi:large subunit ribosomal protein L5
MTKNKKSTSEGNPMLRPKIEKVVVNISVGESGKPLENATKVLKDLTGQNPCKRKAKQTIRDFGIRKGEPIACMATLRNEVAEKFLQLVLPVIDKTLSKNCFDQYGNFSFGIKEHIEIPGVRYRPEIGIFGMDVSISLIRPGYRVKRRQKKRSKIGTKHILLAEEAKLFVQDRLEVQIE